MCSQAYVLCISPNAHFYIARTYVYKLSAASFARVVWRRLRGCSQSHKKKKKNAENKKGKKNLSSFLGESSFTEAKGLYELFIELVCFVTWVAQHSEMVLFRSVQVILIVVIISWMCDDMGSPASGCDSCLGEGKEEGRGREGEGGAAHAWGEANE